MSDELKSKLNACIDLCGGIVDESHPNQDDLREKANNIESILIGVLSKIEWW